MNNARTRGMVLQLFYARADGAFHRPRPDDFTGALISYEALFSACELLDEFGLIEWKSIRRLGGSAFGSGRITPLGLRVAERETHSVLDIVFPCSQGAIIAESRDLLPVLPQAPDIDHHIRQIRDAIETCDDAAADETRAALSALLGHPRLSLDAGN